MPNLLWCRQVHNRRKITLSVSVYKVKVCLACHLETRQSAFKTCIQPNWIVERTGTSLSHSYSDVRSQLHVGNECSIPRCQRLEATFCNVWHVVRPKAKPLYVAHCKVSGTTSGLINSWWQIRAEPSIHSVKCKTSSTSISVSSRLWSNPSMTGFINQGNRENSYFDPWRFSAPFRSSYST